MTVERDRSTMRFVIVDETPHACSYLPGRQATLSLKRPVAALTGVDFDALLAQGERRMGRYFYRTACVGCQACEAIRVPVREFVPSRSQRRSIRKNRDVEVQLAPVDVDAERIELYNRHKRLRGLDSEESGSIGEREYWAFLGDSHVRTIDVRYLVEGRLVGLSVVDFGNRSASSVYHYFDPIESRRSLGVFSVLAEIDLCREMGLDWYYLGYWVRDCQHLAYKSQYLPHERLVDGQWRSFESQKDNPASSPI